MIEWQVRAKVLRIISRSKVGEFGQVDVAQQGNIERGPSSLAARDLGPLLTL